MKTEFKMCKKCEEDAVLCYSCIQNKETIDREAKIKRIRSVKTRCCDCIGHIPITSTIALSTGGCASVLNAYGDPINVTKVRDFDQECRLFNKKEQ